MIFPRDRQQIEDINQKLRDENERGRQRLRRIDRVFVSLIAVVLLWMVIMAFRACAG